MLWADSGEFLINERETYPDAFKPMNGALWAFDGLGGYASFLIFHFIFDTLLIIMIENELFSQCAKFTFKKIPIKNYDL